VSEPAGEDSVSKDMPSTIATPSTAPVGEPSRHERVTFGGPAIGITLATGALFLASLVIQPQSVSHSSLLGMLPFAAILAIVSMGQTLVIQQGGIDLSVPGMLSLTVVLMTHYPNGDSGKLAAALLISLGALLAAGLVTGLLVARIGITSIVATLGMNAVLYGFVINITSGTPRPTTGALHSFASGTVIGIPTTVVVAAALCVATWFVIKRTVIGRRFEAVGASSLGARAAGLESHRYRVTTYVGAALVYWAAGVLLAGVVQTPSVFQGDTYLLPSVAAVVLGGTSLLGGRGSVVASAIAALFLSQLDQLVLTTGVNSAIQNLVQAAVLAVGIAIYSVPWARLRERFALGPATEMPRAVTGEPGEPMAVNVVLRQSQEEE
jgi:ribose transport system permease protein